MANQTTEHTAWDCDRLKCGIPVPADQRKILTSGAGLSALQQLRVQTHLIAQVERLEGELGLIKPAYEASSKQANEALIENVKLQAKVKALTKQLEKNRKLLRW